MKKYKCPSCLSTHSVIRCGHRKKFFVSFVKTAIIISHRFSTVRHADRILVLDDGKIIEEGNHQKLMNKKGLYAELFEIQARGYK